MATVFRPPIIVTIYARPKAQPEYSVNMAVLFTPNPTQPFSQSDWPLTARARPPQKSDLPLLPPPPPPPPVPFNQDLWENAARIPRSLKSEVYFGAFTIYNPNPAIPFSQDIWDSATPRKAKAVGEPYGLSLPPNIIVTPFAQDIWDNPTRTPISLKSDSYAYPRTLVVPVIQAPFAQREWNRPAERRQKARTEEYPIPYPFRFRPFRNEQAIIIPKRQPLKSDFSVNLLPLISLSIKPFKADDWPEAPPKQAKAKVDDVVNFVQGILPPPRPTPTPRNHGIVRDPLNRDAWGRWTPGTGYHQG